MITLSTRLADAVLLFRDNYITTLPVVDSITNRRLINIFSKFDVFRHSTRHVFMRESVFFHYPANRG
ncbi:unnamed protein product [Trichobilharzia regenti]|nr:unnamed protein product [Trichobilharzia regenti]